jgi:hypothetical protein
LLPIMMWLNISLSPYEDYAFGPPRPASEKRPAGLTI